MSLRDVIALWGQCFYQIIYKQNLAIVLFISYPLSYAICLTNEA